VTGARLRSVATIAEMQGRDLGRRRIALTLLAGLPLAFYGALAGHDPAAIIPGGIAMAFALSGAAIFSVLSSREVDQRLALAGFAPVELLAGRLLFLEAFSVPVVGGSSAVMAIGSDPPRPGVLVLAVATVAVVCVTARSRVLADTLHDDVAPLGASIQTVTSNVAAAVQTLTRW